MVKMSDLTESEINKPTLGWVAKENALMHTVRSTINLVTNVLMWLTVFVSLVYSCSGKKINSFYLHIMLSVFGYQLCMCQGTLVLSKYNTWSMYLSRSQRKHLHIALQIVSFVLILAGSIVIMKGDSSHFNSTHGSLGIVALLFSIISLFNGSVANYAYKLSNYAFMIKFFHYFTGILTLLLSAGALTTGFAEVPFTMWMKNDDAVAGLIFITWLFTILVAIDFWINTGQKLRNMFARKY